MIHATSILLACMSHKDEWSFDAQEHRRNRTNTGQESVSQYAWTSKADEQHAYTCDDDMLSWYHSVRLRRVIWLVSKCETSVTYWQLMVVASLSVDGEWMDDGGLTPSVVRYWSSTSPVTHTQYTTTVDQL